MNSTYSFVDEKDEYVGHATYDGSISGPIVAEGKYVSSTYWRASTKPVATIAEAAAAVETLAKSIALRFPNWRRMAKDEARLIADDWRGNPVRVVINFVTEESYPL